MATNFFSGFLALGTGSTTFQELVGTGYARVPVAFGPILGGTTANLSGFTFAASGTWPAATQLGLFGPSGNLALWWNRATPAFSLTSGQTFTLPTGALPLVIPSLLSQSPSVITQWAISSPIGTAERGAVLFTGPNGGQYGGSL